MNIESEISLHGLNIGVTGLDLEQSEHRGIAQVTKNIIYALSSEKANIYLITNYKTTRLGKNLLNSMSETAIKEITISDILEQLKETKDYQNIYLKKLLLYLRLPKIILKHYLNLGKLYGRKYLLSSNHKNIYSDSERMNYIKYLKGIISVPNIFFLCSLKSRRLILGTPKIDLNKFNLDIIISASPLSVKIINPKSDKSKLIQIIHDAIPILYNKHPDKPIPFYNRLKEATNSDKVLYVSKSTKIITHNIIENIENHKNSDIINPIPSLSNDYLKKANLWRINCDPKSNFILFNSSIVSRKNLDFLIHNFLSSRLPENDYKLCVAGKMHNNEYCHYIKRISETHDCINLLGYVSEIDKAWLYLNATAFASPSLTEGFGIPALDACCLGIPTLLSEIPSHAEIYEKFRINQHIKLIPINDNEAWITNLNSLLQNKNKLDENEKNYRLHHYKKNHKDFSEQFQEILKNAIIN
tara:strand:+ start:3770 stop:5182 length:1413 start_codon:yes stop_codon:yes gene_type:complete